MSSKREKLVLVNEGEEPSEAIAREIASDKAAGTYDPSTEYKVKDEGASVTGISKQELGNAQTGGGELDVAKAVEVPPVSVVIKGPADDLKYDEGRDTEFGKAPLYKFEDRSVGIRSGLQTAVSFRPFSLQGGHMMELSNDLKLGRFTNYLTFMEQVDELANKLINLYSGVIVDVPHEPYLGKVRVPVGMGFGPEALSGLDDTDYLSKIHTFLNRKKQDVIEADGSISPYEENVSFLGHPIEIEIRKALEPYNMQNYIKPADLHAYIRAYFTDRENHILPLPYDHDDRFEVMYHPRMSTSFGFFMDTNPRYRETIVNYMQSLIKSAVAVQIANFQESFGSLLRALAINVSTIDRLPGIAKGLRAEDATNLIVNMLTALTMGRWAQLEFTFATTMFAYDLPILIYCIFAKMVIPWHCVSEASVRAIDNYIFIWLMRADIKSGAAGDRYRRLTSVDMSLNNVNYMAEAYSLGLFNKANMHSDFLYTDGRGGGWNVPGGDSGIPFSTDPRFTRFAPPGRRVVMTPMNGQIYLDDFSTAAQIQNFVRFNEFLQGMTLAPRQNAFNPPIKAKEKEAIVSTLATILDGADSFSQLTNRLNNTLLRLGVLATAYPIDASDKAKVDAQVQNGSQAGTEIRNSRVNLTVKLGGAMSIFMLNPMIDTQVISLAHHESCAVIVEIANSLAVVYADVNDRYKKFKVYYTKSRKNEIVQARMKNHPTLSGFFNLLKPQLNDLLDGNNMPTLSSLVTENNPEINRLTVIRGLIMRNLRLFGVTERFYYVPNPTESMMEPSPLSRGKPLFTDVYVLQTNAVTITKRYKSYEDLRDDVLYEKIAGEYKKARNTLNGAIAFEFPMNLGVNEKSLITGAELFEREAPFTTEITESNSETGLLRVVNFTFVQNDLYRRRTANREAQLEMPRYYIDYLPLWIDNHNYTWDMFFHYIRTKTALKVLNPYTYFSFSRRIDV
jgi:hypothetical protein